MPNFNLLLPKEQVRHSKWIFFLQFFNNRINWLSVTVRTSDTPTTRPSYFELRLVKGVIPSKDN